MGERVQSLVERFEQANQQVIDVVEGLTDEQWRATCASEQWSVGVTAHHIATGHPMVAGLIAAMAQGGQLPPITLDDIHRGNAEHAEQYATCSKAETLALLRENGAQASSMLRGLDDEQLDRTATVFGRQMTAAQVAEMILLGHPAQHGQSIQTALGS